ncbi:MAG: 3'-5' exonuclease [Myxococcales bacterium]|nr:3'-5' exonuclease [Myxococcales bacterium]
MDLRANWNECKLAVLDTETTGLNPDKDRIIEVGIAIYQNGTVVEEYQTLIDPECSIPDEVVRITGIQPAELEGAPKFAEVVDDVYARLIDHVVVAYNLAFDRRFIERELERCGRAWPDVPTIDPLVFVRELHRDQGSKRLEAVASRLGIPHPDAHRALNDAIVAAQVLFALASQLPPGLHELITLQQQWAIKQEQEMSGWRSRQSSDFQVSVSGGIDLIDAEGMMSLGPAFVYGGESDPLRALFSLLS